MSTPNDKTEYVVTWDSTIRHSVTMTSGEIVERLGYFPEALNQVPLVNTDLYANARTEDIAHALDFIETADSMLSIQSREIVLVEPA